MDSSWEKACRGLRLTLGSPNRSIFPWPVPVGVHGSPPPLKANVTRKGSPPPVTWAVRGGRKPGTCSILRVSSSAAQERAVWKAKVLEWAPRAGIKRECTLTLSFGSVPPDFLQLHWFSGDALLGALLETTFTEFNKLIHITEYLKNKNSQEENSSSLLKM